MSGAWGVLFVSIMMVLYYDMLVVQEDMLVVQEDWWKVGGLTCCTSIGQIPPVFVVLWRSLARAG